MHNFDAQKTAQFFNETYSALDREITADPDKKLHARDHILIEYILRPRRQNAGKIIDFGCGQGRLVAHLIKEGFDVVGMEKHEGMRRFAESELSEFGVDRVLAGGVDEFAALPSGSFAVVIIMGVVQYLSDRDYQLILSSASRLLRPGGSLAITFQNAFFDLYTFNKYTTDFLMNGLLRSEVKESERASIAQSLAGLVAHPNEPAHARARARDNIFVRLTNPLLIENELAEYGLSLRKKYFYDFFGLPPLLYSEHAEIARRIAQDFEITRAASWEGHFMANAFLAECVKA